MIGVASCSYIIRPVRGLQHSRPFCPPRSDEDAVWSRPRWRRSGWVADLISSSSQSVHSRNVKSEQSALHFDVAQWSVFGVDRLWAVSVSTSLVCHSYLFLHLRSVRSIHQPLGLCTARNLIFCSNAVFVIFFLLSVTGGIVT